MKRPNPAVLSAALLLTLAGAAHAAPDPPTGIPASFRLANLNGITGFRLEGLAEDDHTGFSVATAGDVNGDGIADVIIGAYETGRQGKAYVVFGSRDGFPSSFDLGSLDGTNGFRLNGIDPGDQTGRSVASAGDVNADKVSDLIIGAPGANGNAGRVFVVFGRRGSNPFPPSIDLATLDGTNGFRLNAIDTDDRFGNSVAAAGDVNGDKISDIVIGAPYADPSNNINAGETYVIFGRKTNNPFPASINLTSLDGTNGFRIRGIDPDDASGRSVASAGDFNADKISDIIIGAPFADPGGDSSAGETYIIFGRRKDNPFPASISLGALDGTNGFRANGTDTNDFAGYSVAPAGDINGDKIADVIIGAPNASPDGFSGFGETYVVFGRKAAASSPFPASINLAALDAATGFRIVGPDTGDNCGHSVAAAGDFNADKVGDLIIGSPGSDEGVGDSNVVFGRDVARSSPFPEALNLDTLDGTNGLLLVGVTSGKSSGASVASAGDFNGDTFADVIVGAHAVDLAGLDNAGVAYVIFAPTPEIEIEQNIVEDLSLLGAIEISDGGTLNLGVLTVNETSSVNFDIMNRGLARLTLQNVKVPRGFTITTPPAPAVNARGSTTMSLQITPTRTGTFSGKVSFTTNDADEKKFDFTLQWSASSFAATSGAASTSLPIINLDTLPDLNSDWITNAADIILMLRAINDNNLAGGADLNDDDHVNTDDLILLLNAFGAAQ